MAGSSVGFTLSRAFNLSKSSGLRTDMGLRSRLLKVPLVYEILTNGLGKPGGREWLVNEVIRAEPGMRVLDVGCGTANILNFLPEVTYVGIDHNPDYIAKARQVFESRGTFIAVDVNDDAFRQVGSFDRVIMLGVLHHLNDNECTRLMQSVFKCMAPTAKLITFDNALVKHQHVVARLLAKADRGRFSRSPEGYRALIETAFEIKTEVVRHDLMRVPYSHVAFVAQLPQR